MRILCTILAILVAVLALGLGFGASMAANKIGQSFTWWNATLVTVGCVGGGALIGLLGASGFIMTGMLSERVKKLEKRKKRHRDAYDAE